MFYEVAKEKMLKEKVIAQTSKNDFVEFWKKQIEMLRSIPISYTRTKLELPYDKSFESYEIVFNTHDETMVHAYYSVPLHCDKEKLPCVAYFHGGGGKKEVFPEILATKVCCFAIDVRSQGGTTADKAVYSVEDGYAGLMTKGVTDKNIFYMKNIYLDVVRAMDVIASLPEVDPERIVTYGQSQGGALSIVASALSGRSRKCYACEPSYNCIWERIELGSGVFDGTKKFLRKRPELTDAVFDTVTYFDVNNMASLLQVPTDVCIGLQDPVCLPEFVYSVYTHINGEKELKMYPFALHVVPEAYYMFFLSELAKLYN